MKKQGLSSRERIKSKKDFEELYSSGKIFISSDQKIKAIYLVKENNKDGIAIAAVVSRKQGKAVWRNRVRRLIKEAYRLNKLELTKHCFNSGKKISLIFSAYSLSEKKNKKIGLREIIPGVSELMGKIKSAI